ncbi:MAG: diguanylate cyclase [Pseudomonadota bacterium]
MEKNRNVGEFIIGFSLDPLLSQRQEPASQVITFLFAGILAVYLGMLAYAFVSTKWLDRVRKSNMRLVDGELGENEGSKSPIAEFQDIDDALKQLRLDALELIELQSKARADERIRYVAIHDPLTDHCNRRRLDEHAEQFSTNTPEQSDWLEILHIDLDGFKDVNDKSGHHEGDTVLKIAGRRLGQLRSTAMAIDIFLVGSDEFVVVCLHETRAASEAEPLAPAQDVVESLGRPYITKEADDATFVEVSRVSASVGVTIAPIQDLDLECSLTEADKAMYAANAQGKDTCVLFTPELSDARTERPQLKALRLSTKHTSWPNSAAICCRDTISRAQCPLKNSQRSISNMIVLLKIAVLSVFLQAATAVHADERDELEVLFVNPGFAHGFWGSVTDTMRAAAEDLNINFTVLDADRDRIKMLDLTEQAASRGICDHRQRTPTGPDVSASS